MLAILAMLARERRAVRGSGWFRSSHPLRCAPQLRRRQVGTGKQAHRSNRKAGLARPWRGRECRSEPTTIATCEPFVTEPLGVEMAWLPVDKMTPHGEHSGEAMPGSLGSIPE